MDFKYKAIYYRELDAYAMTGIVAGMAVGSAKQEDRFAGNREA